MRRFFVMIVGLSLLGLLGIGPAAAPALAEVYSAPELTPLIDDEESTPGDESGSVIGDLDVGDDRTAVIAVPEDHEVYSVGVSGEPEPVAGTGEEGTVDDEGPAVDSPITEPLAVARTDDGGTYIADGDGAVHLVDGNRISTAIPAEDLDGTGEILSLSAGSSALYVGTDTGEVHEVEFSGEDAEITETYEVGGNVTGLDARLGGEVYVAKGDSVVSVGATIDPEPLIGAENLPNGVDLVDVAVGPDEVVYAASAQGLVVSPPDSEAFVWPSIPGESESVAVDESSGKVIVEVGGTAYTIQPSEESNPIRFSTRGADVTAGEDVASGTLLRTGDELPAPARAIDIASDRSIGVLHSEGVLDIAHDTGNERFSGFRESDGADGSIVVGESSTRYVLTGGRIHKFINGEYQQSLLHGLAESIASSTGLPELTHMARYNDELLVAGEEYVYTMGADGMLTPFHDGNTPLPGTVRALAVDHDDNSVYVAVQTTEVARVLQFRSAGDRRTVLDSDDVPGGFDPTGMAVGPSGELYVTDSGSSRILRHDGGSGAPSVIAGDYGDEPAALSADETPALETTLDDPAAPAVDSEGNLVFSANNAVYVLPDAAKAPTTNEPYAMVTMSLLVLAAVGAAAGLLLVIRRRIESMHR